MDRNEATFKELCREVIYGRFRGRVILDCDEGLIQDVEVHARRVPPWKRQTGSGVDDRLDKP